jgi:hypothetical protein
MDKNNILVLRNREKPDFYMIYSGWYQKQPEFVLAKMNHTGKYKDCGYPLVKVDLVCDFETELDVTCFLDYIETNIATDHDIIQFYNHGTCKAWHQLKSVDTDQWQKDFIAYQKKQNQRTQQTRQLSLF